METGGTKANGLKDKEIDDLHPRDDIDSMCPEKKEKADSLELRTAKMQRWNHSNRQLQYKRLQIIKTV